MEKIVNNFMVCLRCLTYNHANYITEALNGFALQQTDFPFVCCVIDDASTDGEQDVIKKYLNHHFDIADTTIAFERETDFAHISFAQHKTNRHCYIAVLYLKFNHNEIKKDKLAYLSEWRDTARYEAFCEGDDYWINPYKLQKQVDFLERNDNYAMCYSKCKKYYQQSGKFSSVTFGGPLNTFDQLIKCNTIPTLTVLTRIELLKQYSQENHSFGKRWKMGDYPLWLWLSQHGKIFFSQDITGVYRVLENSASNYVDIQKREEFLISIDDIQKYFAQLYGRNELHDVNNIYSILHRNAVEYGNFEKEKKYYLLINKKSIIQKIKHIICKRAFLYRMFSGHLFYSKKA